MSNVLRGIGSHRPLGIALLALVAMIGGCENGSVPYGNSGTYLWLGTNPGDPLTAIHGAVASDFVVYESHALLGGPTHGKNLAVRELTAPTTGRCVLVIDHSSSKLASYGGTTRLAAARGAANAFIDGMPAGTQLEIISFDALVQQLTPFTNDGATLHTAVDSIIPGDGTVIFDAGLLAVSHLSAAGSDGTIILVTDGTDYDSVGTRAQLIEAAVAAHVRILTVGVGTGGSEDYDPVQLAYIASQTGGSFHGAADPDGLGYAFVQTTRALGGDNYRLEWESNVGAGEVVTTRIVYHEGLSDEQTVYDGMLYTSP